MIRTIHVTWRQMQVILAVQREGKARLLVFYYCPGQPDGRVWGIDYFDGPNGVKG